MPHSSTLQHVADIVVRRVLANANDPGDVSSDLDREYPFGDDPQAREIWLDAVRQYVSEYPKKSIYSLGRESADANLDQNT